MGNPADTNEKILMKDHDILIALHTQNQELIRRVDSLSLQINSTQESNYREFRTVAVNQAKLDGDVKALQTKNEEQDARMEKMDTRWKIGDIIIAIGTITTFFVAWFK